jgi:tetratricopeptide (TPR) repeat protein
VLVRAVVDGGTVVPRQHAHLLDDGESGPWLKWRAAAARAGSPVPPDRRRADRAPVTLPALPEQFTGRDELVRELLGWLDPAGQHGGATVVSAADGMGGVGKTALAVHVAGLALRRGWFPGGTLFEDLRGFSADEPLTQGAVAGRLLRASGVPGREVPESAEDRVRMWRDQLRRLGEEGRPALVVLDNAESVAQVVQLVPERPHRMLVTSRRTLAAMGARRIQVRPFEPADAVGFLGCGLGTAWPGDDRVARAPDDANRLASLCGRLPLALRIVVALLRDEPDRPLADLVTELADTCTRLERLQYDDVDENGRPLAVMAAFDLSYGRLVADPERARAFRLLARVPGPDVAVETAAALLDRPVVTTRRLLADLARVSLVDQERERWRMHDLVRLYARQRSDEHAVEDQRERAMDLLFGFYHRVVGQVNAWLYDWQSARSGTFATRKEAVAWLDAERECVIAAIAEAHESQRWDSTHRLATAVAGYLEFRHRPDEAIAVGTRDVSAAAHLGRRAACGAIMTLGNAYRMAARYAEAVQELERARDLGDEELDDHQSPILHNLGLAYFQLGRFADAVTCHERDLALCEAANDLGGAAEAMVALGDALRRSRRFREAGAQLNKAIRIFDQLGDVTGLMRARTNIALTCLDGYSGRAAYTIWQLCMALKAARDLDDRAGQAIALLNLAPAFLKRCQCCHAAAAAWSAERAEVMFRELGDDRRQAHARELLRVARPLTENCSEEDHEGCPEQNLPDAMVRVAWLNDLPRAVLNGDYWRLDEVRFVGSAMVGPTPDGSIPETFTWNRLGLLLDGNDQPVEESVTFLRGHTQLTEDEALRIGLFIGNRPDVVAMAANYVNRHRLDGTEYLELLHDMRLDDYSPAGSPHPHAVGAAKAAMLTIRSVEHEGTHVRAVLDVAALLAPALLDHLGPVSGLLDSDLDAAVAVLTDAAVLTAGATVMSPAAREAALHCAARDGRLPAVVGKVTGVLVSEVESVIVTPTKRTEVERLTGQIEAVWAAVRPTLDRTASELAAALLRLRGLVVNLYIGQKDRAAVLLGDDVLDECQRLLGPSHGETWRARNNLAGAHGMTGDPDRACALLAANLRVIPAGVDHLEILRTRYNLGAMQLLARRPIRAVRVLEEVHADRERVLGKDHPDNQDTQDLLTAARQAVVAGSGTMDAWRPPLWP